jgi:hypothetical protein
MTVIGKSDRDNVRHEISGGTSGYNLPLETARNNYKHSHIRVSSLSLTILLVVAPMSSEHVSTRVNSAHLPKFVGQIVRLASQVLRVTIFLIHSTPSSSCAHADNYLICSNLGTQ